MSIYDRDYYRRGYGRAGSGDSICRQLIIINVIIFFFTGLTGDFGNHLVEMTALNAISIRNFQVWRFFTYMFVHGGFWHLFFNMYALHLFGRLLEAPLGRNRFLILYLSSGVIGGLLWQIFNWNHFFICIGASGAVFGVMVAAAMAYPDTTFMLLIPPIPIKLWAMVWIYCALEILQLMSSTSSIAHLAHLGGALGGFIYMRRLGCRLKSPHLQGLLEWWSRLMRSIFPPRPKSSRPYQFPGDSTVDDGKLNTEELNRILDKISHMGYNSLTDEERNILQRASEYLKSR